MNELTEFGGNVAAFEQTKQTYVARQATLSQIQMSPCFQNLHSDFLFSINSYNATYVRVHILENTLHKEQHFWATSVVIPTCPASKSNTVVAWKVIHILPIVSNAIKCVFYSYFTMNIHTGTRLQILKQCSFQRMLVFQFTHCFRMCKLGRFVYKCKLGRIQHPSLLAGARALGDIFMILLSCRMERVNRWNLLGVTTSLVPLPKVSL